MRVGNGEDVIDQRPIFGSFVCWVQYHLDLARSHDLQLVDVDMPSIKTVSFSPYGLSGFRASDQRPIFGSLARLGIIWIRLDVTVYVFN